MSDKKRKSEYLLSELGGIDESFLVEAESYRKKRDHKWLKPLVAVACACVFVVGVMVSVPRLDKNLSAESVNNSNVSLKGDKDNAYLEAATEADPEMTEAGAESEPEVSRFGFDALLSSQEGYFIYDSFFDVPREQGKTYILWQHIDGGKLFMSRPLDDGEVESMNKRLGIGEPVGADSPTREFNVWILRGDGSVVSPYLVGSSGNIGKSLFDYEAEIIPQDQLISLIAKILADKPQN